MTQKYPKKKNFIVTILFAAFLLLVSSTVVQASTNPLEKMPKKDNEVLNKAIFGKGATFITEFYSSEIKIRVSSSNPKVATVKSGNEKYPNYADPSNPQYYAWYEVIPISAGNTQIKATVTINKKSYTKTCKYTVYKWENPFKSIKIGSTDYQSRLKKKGTYELNRKTISGKLTYKLNPDFVIKDIRASYYSDPDKKYLTEWVSLKNGQTLPKNTVSIDIWAKSKKTKLEKYTIGISVPLKYRYDNLPLK